MYKAVINADATHTLFINPDPFIIPEECTMLSFFKKNLTSSILLLLATLLCGLSFNTQAETASSVKVKESMKIMKAWSKILGEPRLEADQHLYFGKTHINADFYIVDGIKSRYGGNATFFAKKDDGFIRISTNVMKDGNRAVGTMLDPKGPVLPLIKQGKPFYGVVDILGKMHDTGYEPVINSKGEILGIYYVGYLVE